MNFELKLNSLDADRVNSLFNKFDREGVKKIIRQSARKGINEVTKQARKNLQGEIKPSKSMIDSIRTNAYNESEYFIGAISKAKKSKKYYDGFKLLFFEKGTKERKTKKGKSTGRIKPTNFFNKAVSSKGNVAVQKFIQGVERQINKIKNE